MSPLTMSSGSKFIAKKVTPFFTRSFPAHFLCRADLSRPPDARPLAPAPAPALLLLLVVSPAFPSSSPARSTTDCGSTSSAMGILAYLVFRCLGALALPPLPPADFFSSLFTQQALYALGCCRLRWRNGLPSDPWGIFNTALHGLISPVSLSLTGTQHRKLWPPRSTGSNNTPSSKSRDRSGLLFRPSACRTVTVIESLSGPHSAAITSLKLLWSVILSPGSPGRCTVLKSKGATSPRAPFSSWAAAAALRLRLSVPSAGPASPPAPGTTSIPVGLSLLSTPMFVRLGFAYAVEVGAVGR
mmetsp:Transcript_3346/g.7476  ORF Transcript_3346/g.7476 Transcript_3346/m.7476 type:complete len:300 (-) Transcript_3346:399-1298(-)